MATKVIIIDSIIGGWAKSAYFARPDEFAWSQAIDPDVAIGGSQQILQPSGMLCPVGYSKFSSTNVTAAVVAIITEPKDALVYAVLTNGRLISYSTSLASETLVGTVTGSNAQGAAYYNNYIYIFGTGASKDDVSRYGPLNNSPTLVDNVWKGATLGSQSALTNTTYPAISGSNLMPNHWAKVHTDNALYFCDVVNGRGVIHKIKTTKTTDEGDTNDGSSFNVLDLPSSFFPTSVESFGTDLAVLAIPSLNATLIQGNATLFLWDTISDTFYRQVPLPDTWGTAMLNHNGTLKIWSGGQNTRTRILAYYGGNSVTEIGSMELGSPPLAGAVDSVGGRLVFAGINGGTPNGSEGQVFAMGSNKFTFPLGLHGIAQSSSSSASAITALKYVRSVTESPSVYDSYPQLIFGFEAGASFGIDQESSSATSNAIYFSQIFKVGAPFTLRSMRLAFDRDLTASTILAIQFNLDGGQDQSTTFSIDGTSHSGKSVLFQFPSSGTTMVRGVQDFFFKILWNASAPLNILLPIKIELEVEDWHTTA